MSRTSQLFRFESSSLRLDSKIVSVLLISSFTSVIVLVLSIKCSCDFFIFFAYSAKLNRGISARKQTTTRTALSSTFQKIKPTNFRSTLQEWKTKRIYIIYLNSEKISQALKLTVRAKVECKRKTRPKSVKVFAHFSIQPSCVWYQIKGLP